MGQADPNPRLVSLDQFRGYTVLGMFLVNFAGAFAILPATIRHHHTHVSYADTIMPQFLFAVGFAYRLMLLRRRETSGTWTTYRRVIERCLGLLLIGVIIHGVDGGAKNWEELKAQGLDGFFLTGFQRKPFQALVHFEQPGAHGPVHRLLDAISQHGTPVDYARRAGHQPPLASPSGPPSGLNLTAPTSSQPQVRGGRGAAATARARARPDAYPLPSTDLWALALMRAG